MRIVIAEDLFLLRDGLERTLTEHGHDVIASVDNGPSLRAALTKLAPDIAIVDVRLPRPSPTRACRSPSNHAVRILDCPCS